MDSMYFLIRLVVKPFISHVWVKEISGIEKIPEKGAAILAMNHQSYFDFFCLAALCPRNVHFLAAEKFFDHWLWNILMRVTRQIRVDRISSDKREMHRLVHQHLEAGKLIGIFPEGTRSPHEFDMLKAFPGVARYCLDKKIPIIPIGIKGTFTIMSRYHKKIQFAKIVSIHVGDPMNFYHYHSRTSFSDLDYKTITYQVMKEISTLSGKNYDHDL